MLKISKNVQVVGLSSLGGALEFYDFVVYAIFARYIQHNFFPAGNQLLSLLATFAVFSVGYLIRPLGGLIMSHFGDIIGRKKVFSLSIFLMAGSTFLMGLVPSYHSIGITGTLLFISLRLVQGFSLGGEIPGAITFTTEHLQKRKGLACGFIFCCINMGIFIGDAVEYLLSHFLSEAIIMEWAWRIPFLLGGLLGVVSYFLRQKIEESPIFQAQAHDREKLPIQYLIKNYPKQILQGIGVTSLMASIITVTFLYLPTILTELYHIPHQQITTDNALSLVFFSLLIVVAGYVSDFMNRRLLVIVGSTLLMTITYPMYVHLQAQPQHLLWLLCLTGTISATITGTVPSLLAELFPTKVRFTGISLCYNVGFGVFGGLSPLIITWMIHQTGDIKSPAYYLIAASCIALISAYSLPKRLAHAF